MSSRVHGACQLLNVMAAMVLTVLIVRRGMAAGENESMLFLPGRG
jgi:hypothetical protein